MASSSPLFRRKAYAASFDLGQTAKEIASSFAYSLRLANQSLHTEIDDGISMDGYPGPLGQVLINLISNAQVHAFEEMNTGEMRLTARVSPEGRVHMEFSDNGKGKGIAQQNLKRIFDPFFTTKLGQGGSGLGLRVLST